MIYSAIGLKHTQVGVCWYRSRTWNIWVWVVIVCPFVVTPLLDKVLSWVIGVASVAGAGSLSTPFVVGTPLVRVGSTGLVGAGGTQGAAGIDGFTVKREG